MKTKMWQTNNFCDAVKVGLRGKFIAVNSYFKKEGRSWINSLSLHLKELEKESKLSYMFKHPHFRVYIQSISKKNSKKYLCTHLQHHSQYLESENNQTVHRQEKV